MAVIQSGASATQWTIDTTSDAGRVTFYDTNGNPMSNVSSLGNVLNALNAAVTITLGGQSTAGINISGTTGTLTLSFEATIDNTNWFAISATPLPSGATATSTSANGQWVVDLGGFYAVRTRISAFTSGSMTVSVVVSPNNSKNISQAVTFTGGVSQGAPNTIANSWPVEVTDGTNILGTPTHPVRTDPTGTTTQPVSISGTVPVSGTVTSNQGTANTIGNSWPVEVTDGTNVLGTSAHPVRTDPTGVTTQPISGTTTANQGTAAALSGHWPVQVTDGTNVMPTGDAVGRAIFEKITDGTNTATVTASSALKVDGSAVTQPVSGTVTAAQATAANLNATVAQGAPAATGNSWPTKITDGTNGPVSVTPASTSPSATDPALVVTISPNSPPSATNTGVISTNNSSTATLGAGATFTGTGESTLSYESISITVMAIAASAPPGTLIVEQSSDGTNWDIQDSFAVTGGTASPTGEFDIIVPLEASNFRIVYTNGATAQTAFRLQTIKWPIKTSVPNATQKGVQPAVFTATQDAKDSGRVVKNYQATAIATTTTDTMVTLTPSSDFATGGSGTSFTVTAGKRLRIQTISVAFRAGTAANLAANFRFRVSTSGAVTTATAVAVSLASQSTNATIGSIGVGFVNFPDGLELSGTMQFGISQLSTLTTSTVDVSIVGYEY